MGQSSRKDDMSRKDGMYLSSSRRRESFGVIREELSGFARRSVVEGAVSPAILFGKVRLMKGMGRGYRMLNECQQ